MVAIHGRNRRESGGVRLPEGAVARMMHGAAVNATSDAHVFPRGGTDPAQATVAPICHGGTHARIQAVRLALRSRAAVEHRARDCDHGDGGHTPRESAVAA